MKSLLLLAAATFLIGCSSVHKETRDYRSWLYSAKKWEPEYLPKDSGSGVIFRFYGEKDPANLVYDRSFNFWSYPLDTVVVKNTVYEEIRPYSLTFPAEVTYIHYFINNIPLSVTFKADSADRSKYLDPSYQPPVRISGVIPKADSTDKYTAELPPNTYLLSGQPNYNDSRYGFSYHIILKDLIVKQGYWSIIKFVFYRPQPAELY